MEGSQWTFEKLDAVASGRETAAFVWLDAEMQWSLDRRVVAFRGERREECCRGEGSKKDRRRIAWAMACACGTIER